MKKDTFLEALRGALSPLGGGKNYCVGLYPLLALIGVPARSVALVSDKPTLAREYIIKLLGGKWFSFNDRGGDRVTVVCPQSGGRKVVMTALASGGIEKHLASLSFTPLSLAFDLSGNGPPVLIDPFGALMDAERGNLRLTPGRKSPDPGMCLTALELFGEWGFRPDAEALSEIRRSSSFLAASQDGRAKRTLLRLFGGKNLSDKARAMMDFGVMSALLPEVEALVPVPQNYYHHLGVWEHTLETLDNLESILEDPGVFFRKGSLRISRHLRENLTEGFDRRAFLGLAGLIHDVGKALTMSVESSGRIRFQGHQLESGMLASRIAARLGISVRGSIYLRSVAMNHMAFGFLLKEGETTESRLRYMRMLGRSCPDVAILSLADRLATRGEASNRESLERFTRLITRVMDDYFWDKDAATFVSGGEVAAMLGAQGHVVGEALLKLKVAMRERLVNSRAEAFEFIEPSFKSGNSSGFLDGGEKV